jgi:hypothetical protein
MIDKTKSTVYQDEDIVVSMESGRGGTPRVFDGRAHCASNYPPRPSQSLRDVPPRPDSL